jgi:hypothetical protein
MESQVLYSFYTLRGRALGDSVEIWVESITGKDRQTVFCILQFLTGSTMLR